MTLATRAKRQSPGFRWNPPFRRAAGVVEVDFETPPRARARSGQRLAVVRLLPVLLDSACLAVAWLAVVAVLGTPSSMETASFTGFAIASMIVAGLIHAFMGLYAAGPAALGIIDVTNVVRASLGWGTLAAGAAFLIEPPIPQAWVALSCLFGCVLVAATRRALWHWCPDHGKSLYGRPSPADPDVRLGYDMGRLRKRYMVIAAMGGRRQRCQEVLKRGVDLVLTPVIIAFTLPVMAVAALVILVSEGRPILFRQRRVGRNGVPFTIFKFRTMVPDAEKQLIDLRELNERDGPLFKLTHDPRVTRTGRLLRESSIDELPQLFNVLVGTMSLVGPRPALADETELFEADLLRRHHLRPGITGLWQVRSRDDASFESYRYLDLCYLENWSVLTDMVILFATVPAVLRRGWSLLLRAAPGNSFSAGRRLMVRLGRRPQDDGGVLAPAGASLFPAATASAPGVREVILSSSLDVALPMNEAGLSQGR
ncbi:MAG TPA: sugar transferase [Acidimicrobiales bacterium]|nr:sugar transferase [Acidimicrobiales bacterium]